MKRSNQDCLWARPNAFNPYTLFLAPTQLYFEISACLSGKTRQEIIEEDKNQTTNLGDLINTIITLFL